MNRGDSPWPDSSPMHRQPLLQPTPAGKTGGWCEYEAASDVRSLKKCVVPSDSSPQSMFTIEKPTPSHPGGTTAVIAPCSNASRSTSDSAMTSTLPAIAPSPAVTARRATPLPIRPPDRTKCSSVVPPPSHATPCGSGGQLKTGETMPTATKPPVSGKAAPRKIPAQTSDPTGSGCTRRSGEDPPEGAPGPESSCCERGSSGTPTAGQKEGKFCECWHCEFFGHSLVGYSSLHFISFHSNI